MTQTQNLYYSVFFLSDFSLHIVFTCPRSCRASSRVLRALPQLSVGLIAWVPHFTTGIAWALRVGVPCLQKAQRHLKERWVCIADFTMQIGRKKALLVLRVPLTAVNTGKALTLPQGAVIGLRLGETGNGELVTTDLLALFERCGWPAHVGSACGSASKKGMVDTLLKAPNSASWISDLTHVVANALQPYYADLSLFQQFQTLCTRLRQRLQQTRLAFLIPPTARAKGRVLHVSRQATWGLRPIAYWQEKEREQAPEASALAYALRGLKPLQPFLTTFVRNAQCVNEVMQIVKTQGVSGATIQACQDRLGA